MSDAFQIGEIYHVQVTPSVVWFEARLVTTDGQVEVTKSGNSFLDPGNRLELTAAHELFPLDGAPFPTHKYDRGSAALALLKEDRDKPEQYR